MQPWLDKALFRWARHSLRMLDGGGGWNYSSLANIAPKATSYRSGTVWDETHHDLDHLQAAINALPEQLKALVVVYYQHTSGNKSETARKLEISRGTVIARLAKSHTEIVATLNRR